MNYNSEEEFLKNYNSDLYKKLSLTVDILILSVSSEEISNYRKTDKKKMSILLVKRDNYPFKDKWCLPGGFVGYDEELEDAPKRILEKETNLKNVYLEQLYTFGNINRDPRMRVVSTSYMSLVNKDNLKEVLSDNSSFFDITNFIENNNTIELELNNGKETIKLKYKKELNNVTSNNYKYEIGKIINKSY